MEAEYYGDGWDPTKAALGNEASEQESIEAKGARVDQRAQSVGADSQENLDVDDEETRQAGRFSMQFEHVVSDDVFEAEDALTRREQSSRGDDDAFDELVLPERFWFK